MCHIFTLYMNSSIETAPPCKILEQSVHYWWRYCISKIWGIQVSSANAVWLLIFFYVASDTLPLYKIWKQSDYLIWRYCILKIWGIQVSFGSECSCSSHRRVSNFNSKVPQGGIYPHIKFERDRLNIFRVRVFTSSGSTGGHGLGGDAKTIISPNTSFGDIIMGN